MSSKLSNVTPCQSLLAGATAGGVESLVTYPTEFVKTRQQLLSGHARSQSPIQTLTSTIRNHGIGRLYTGGAAFCISNASKSGVRFLTFNFARDYMPRDVSGNTTVSGNMLAGICAGVAESVLVLTPGENLKTRLIEDRAGAHTYRSSTQAIHDILRNEGPLNFYRGVWPVTLKQSSNAMVRFTSYNCLSASLQDIVGGPTSAVAGALAGVITVYCTMPFDNLKTQLQSRQGYGMYTGSWDCARKLVQRGGVLTLWRGTTPRLVRLSVSS
ncbi:mitochondrial carrier [Macroventuria anomochaeta]|uniref:Mitochondrial carrier n=1 Tax=Macroventuria anomochaeta TaxID=301207 RepID=A0ACB6RJU3_9PLEO|nr:mitochondrial carrier [Macroventuria anomochaeta]KAF2622141.1 mitochondrial carrier [Macroventuria anomochaeta]